MRGVKHGSTAFKEEGLYLGAERIGLGLVISGRIIPKDEFRQGCRKDSTSEEITPQDQR